jgi:microcystin-dependent protein
MEICLEKINFRILLISFTVLQEKFFEAAKHPDRTRSCSFSFLRSAGPRYGLATSLSCAQTPVYNRRLSMSTPYVGEIRMAGFNFAPAGWALCNGQTLAISQYDVLFNLIGTTYGGDGVNTFSLPNLQSRIPFHQGTIPGNTMVMGQISGSENVTLTTTQIPSHTHALNANSAAGSQQSPGNGVWAASNLDQFATQAATHGMAASAILSTGGNLPHDNIPPFLVVNFIISLFGVYPSQG